MVDGKRSIHANVFRGFFGHLSRHHPLDIQHETSRPSQEMSQTSVLGTLFGLCCIAMARVNHLLHRRLVSCSAGGTHFLLISAMAVFLVRIFRPGPVRHRGRIQDGVCEPLKRIKHH